MNYTADIKKYEPLTSKLSVVEPVFTKRTLPAFPCQYIHSVFVNLRDARQAVLALHSAGLDKQNIHVLQGRTFVEAIAQSRSPFAFFALTSYDAYLREAGRGRTFVSVYPTSYDQLKQIRSLLAAHHAHLIKYIDTWTINQLRL